MSKKRNVGGINISNVVSVSDQAQPESKKKSNWPTIILIILTFLLLIAALLVIPEVRRGLGLESSHPTKTNSGTDHTPLVSPSVDKGGTESSSPSTSDRTIISNVILTYYDNIHNDRSKNINPDRAWEVLTPFLQNKLGGRDAWGTLVPIDSRFVYIIHPNDLENENIFHIDIPYASVDMFLEIWDDKSSAVFQEGNTITICLVRDSGKWLINGINTTLISLNQCASE